MSGRMKEIRKMSAKERDKLKQDLHDLPNWAKKIIIKSDKAQFAAYWYRRELVAFRSALHDLCKDDARGLAFEDSVRSAKNKVHDALDQLMDKSDKAERIAVRKQVVADMEKYRETIAKALKKRSHHKKEVAV